MSLETIFFLLLIPWLVFVWLNWSRAVALVVFFLPLYLVKINIYGYPLNGLEAVVAVIFITAWLKGYGSDLIKFLKQPKTKLWLRPIVLWLLSGLAGVAVAGNLKIAAGIFKGWLLWPLLWWWLSAYIVSSNKLDRDFFWRLAVKALVFNGLLMSVVAIFYWLSMGGRAGGLYNSPNVLAMYLLPIVVLSLYQALSKDDLSKTSGQGKVIFLGSAGLMILAIFLTGSYAALLSLLSVIIFWLFFKKSSMAKFKVGLLAVLVVLGLFLPALVSVNKTWPWPSHSNQIYGLNSGQIRQIFWREALGVILNNPIMGIGLGSWQELFTKTIQPNLAENKLPGYSIEFYYASLFPHNLYLTVWLFQGLLGLLSLIWLFFKVAKSNWLLPFLMLWPWLVYALVDTPLYKNDYGFLLSFILLGVFYKELKDNHVLIYG